MTTIQSDLEAIHSRHTLLRDGKVISPSQNTGRCTKLPL
jgi:hypothetical protein